MTEQIAASSIEQSRQPGLVELQHGETDAIALVMTETLHVQTPFIEGEERRPAQLAIIEMGDKDTTRMTVWGSATKAGNFDPTKGVILTPHGEKFADAVQKGHYTTLEPGTAEEPDRRAQIGNNDLSKRIFGKMGDVAPVQVEAGVTADGTLRISNKSNLGGLRVLRCGVESPQATEAAHSLHEVERQVVAEEVGEVVVDDAVEQPLLAGPAETPDEAWSDATIHGNRTESKLNLSTQINVGVEPAAAAIAPQKLNLMDAINGNPTTPPTPSETVRKEPRLNLEINASLATPDQESAYKDADMESIFSSGATFEQALTDQQLDPNMRHGLRQLAEAWKSLQVAATTTEVWDEMIKPKLTQLNEVVPVAKLEAGKVMDSTAELAQQLNRAASALENGELDEFANAIRLVGEPSQQFREAFNGVELKHAEDFQKATNLLSQEEVEGDDRVRRVSLQAQYGVLSESEADAFTAEIGASIRSKEDIDATAQSLKAKMPESQVNWRQRQQVIQEAAAFARVASNGSQVDPRDISRMQNSLEILSEMVGRGQYRTNPAEVANVIREGAANAQFIYQNFEIVARFINRAAAEIENAR